MTPGYHCGELPAMSVGHRSWPSQQQMHLELTKPSSSLPTLTAIWVLYFPIEDVQAGWLDHFLTNTDIPNNVHPKHQQCGVIQDTLKVYMCPQGCPATVYCHRMLPWAKMQHLCMPIVTTLSWEFGVPG